MINRSIEGGKVKLTVPAARAAQEEKTLAG